MGEHRFGADDKCVECGIPWGSARRLAELEADVAASRSELQRSDEVVADLRRQLAQAQADIDEALQRKADREAGWESRWKEQRERAEQAQARVGFMQGLLAGFATSETKDADELRERMLGALEELDIPAGAQRLLAAHDALRELVRLKRNKIHLETAADTATMRALRRNYEVSKGPAWDAAFAMFPE